MARLKTFGVNYQISRDWPIDAPEESHHRQRLVIVATTSRQKALALFSEAGVNGLSLGYLDNYGYCDMGGHAAFVATAEPGKVFYSPRAHHDEYVPVPTEPHEGAPS
jgi:hypothetical protein